MYPGLYIFALGFQKLEWKCLQGITPDNLCELCPPLDRWRAWWHERSDPSSCRSRCQSFRRIFWTIAIILLINHLRLYRISGLFYIRYLAGYPVALYTKLYILWAMALNYLNEKIKKIKRNKRKVGRNKKKKMKKKILNSFTIKYLFFSWISGIRQINGRISG